MFYHFWQKFENSKWPPFLGRGKFFKEIEANLCFTIFGPPFLGRGKFLENCKEHSLDTLWVENFDEIALSRTVKEIEANLCFAIFGKNSKIQNDKEYTP